jgi:osmotically-inducible protein OsmY
MTMTRIHQTPTRTRTTALLATAVASVMLMACGQHELGAGDAAEAAVNRATAAVSPPPNAQQLEAKSREAALDSAITAEIKAQFASDPPLNALHIQVETREGLVVLSGKAPDASLKERATRLAITVKDVLSVDNKMVLPS